MALAWKAGWVNSPQGFESPILRHTDAGLTCENADRRPPGGRSAFVSPGLVVSVLVSVGHVAQSPQGKCAFSAHADQTGSDASGVIFRILAHAEVPRASFLDRCP